MDLDPSIASEIRLIQKFTRAREEYRSLLQKVDSVLNSAKLWAVEWEHLDLGPLHHNPKWIPPEGHQLLTLSYNRLRLKLQLLQLCAPPLPSPLDG